jgi:hypothetical protein
MRTTVKRPQYRRLHVGYAAISYSLGTLRHRPEHRRSSMLFHDYNSG